MRLGARQETTIIQRHLHNALTRGLSAYATDQALWTQLFVDTWALPADEVEAYRRYFAANPIKVVHGYPRAAQTRGPTIYLFMEGEDQPQHAVGDAGGAGGAGQGSAGIGVGAGAVGVDSSLLNSSMWTHNVTLSCVAFESVERCYYLYEIVKSVMIAAKDFLQAAPYHLSLISYGGSDTQPDFEHNPDILFIRNLQFRCMREFSVLDKAGSLSRYFKIEGVTLDPGSDQTAGIDIPLIGVHPVIPPAEEQQVP